MTKITMGKDSAIDSENDGDSVLIGIYGSQESLWSFVNKSEVRVWIEEKLQALFQCLAHYFWMFITYFVKTCRETLNCIRKELPEYQNLLIHSGDLVL